MSVEVWEMSMALLMVVWRGCQREVVGWISRVFFGVVLVRMAGPRGLRRKGGGGSFFCERVVCICESWTRSCGVEAIRVSASGDSVAS